MKNTYFFVPIIGTKKRSFILLSVLHKAHKGDRRPERHPELKVNTHKNHITVYTPESRMPFGGL